VGVNTTRDINQVGHGFVVGDVLYFDSIYIKAQADSDTTAETVGIVSAVGGPNDFTLLTDGYIDTLSGLTNNRVYFLSAVTPGALSLTEPVGTDQVSKPLLVTVSTTAGYFNNLRGQLILPYNDDNSRLFV